jgi:hypothetical protein
MSRVTTKHKHQDNHTNTSNNTSDKVAQLSLTDENKRSVLDTTIKEVRQEFRSHHQQLLVKRKELITRLGKAFEAVVSNPKSICKQIKNSLREEITDKIISARDIERYCPNKWKKNTKSKNDNLSFSKQVEDKPRQQVVVTQEGKSIIVNETSSDGINQLHDQTKQKGTDADDNNEVRTTTANQGKSVSHNELTAITESSTIVQRLQSHPSDKECSQYVEYRIQREKYGIMRDAMDNSKASMFLKFDRNKNFLGAEPDVVFDISGGQ